MQGWQSADEAPIVAAAAAQVAVAALSPSGPPGSPPPDPPADPAPPVAGCTEHERPLPPWQSGMGGGRLVVLEQAIATRVHTLQAQGLSGMPCFITGIWWAEELG